MYYLSGVQMEHFSNPLTKHFRQPKIYISFPSGGNFYQRGSLEQTETGEYPVYAMTAKDELKFKTPDALLNGQSTVDVIQSCIPNIKNAWAVPSIDVDAILIAIRIATYGEKMEIRTTIPNTEIERSYEVNLTMLLDQLRSQQYENSVFVDDFKIELAPLSYKFFTESAMKTFEEQRLFRSLNDDSLTETEKLQRFNESFNRITDLNISIIAKSVVSVQYRDEPVVTKREFIDEFFNNIDKNIFQELIKHVEEQKSKFTIKPMEVTTTEEDRAAGAPDTFTVPITFDQSNFFAKGS
jgi:hypothetical protein